MSQTKAQLLDPKGDVTYSGHITGVGATFTGNITAADGIFSGNVSVAGTLTKQDVTNVDSVGLITARSGVRVTAGGLDVTGVSTFAGYINLAQKIVHTGDPDTSIEFDTNIIKFETAGGQRLRISDDGKIGIGTDIIRGGIDVFGDGSSYPTLRLGTELYQTEGEDIRFGRIDAGATDVRYHSIWTRHDGSDSGNNIQFRIHDATGAPHTSQAKVLTLTGAGDASLSASGDVMGVSRLTILPADRTSAFDASDGDTWHDVVLKQTGSAGNNAVGIAFETSTSGYHKNAGTGIAAVKNGTNNDYGSHLVFITRPQSGAASEKLRISDAGALGIGGATYGNAGQVLTSGGSGAAISWADAAGGAEYAGIASGSISTGNPVIVHPDGKLEKVKNSYTQDIQIGGAANGDTEIDDPGVRPLYFPDEDGTERYLFLYRKSMSPYYRTATRAGNSLSLSSRNQWNGGNGAGNFAVGYNPDRKRAVMIFYQQSPGGYCAVQIIRPNGSSIAQGSTVQVDTGGSVNGVGVAYHGDDKFIIAWSRGGTVYSKILTNTSSSNYTGISLGNTVTVGSAGGNIGSRISISEKDNNGKHMLFYPVFPTGSRYSGFGINYTVISVSGTTPSFGSISHLGGNAEREYEANNMLVDSSFDSSQNRYLVVYKQVHDGTGTYINKTYVVNATISGTSITMSSQVELTNNITETTPSTAFDSNLNKHFVFLYSTANSNSVVAHPFTITGSAAPSAGSTFNVSTGEKVWYGKVIFNATIGKLIFGARNASSSGAGNWLRARVISTSQVETNLKRENFIGLSKGNYTDGNTAKVNVNGSVDENQSSLTPGQTYFVQKDGTLALTSDTERVVAGQAVSSTNLIVRDENPRQGILGYWKYHLRNCGNYKSWCTCGWVGAYDRDANNSCNFCVGKWQPWCCTSYGANNKFIDAYNLSDENGGNMCIGCGGMSCNTPFCVSPNACNNSCPDGRFWFPSEGMYCYNFNMMWLNCQGMAQGGCWAVVTNYAAKCCANRACNTGMLQIDTWRGNPNMCLYCDSKKYANNIRLSGMVSVPDKDINFIAWKLCNYSLGAQVQSDGFIQCENGMQCWYNYVSFTKLSNNPGMCYIN
tara:strand:- start:1413 stop:4727 length:3315 start_codon:yes stop_codon:yes gene_type:complete